MARARLNSLISLLKAASKPQVPGPTIDCAGTAWLRRTSRISRSRSTASAAGSDSNIDFAIAPKGTGVLRFGTHSALAAETVTGYITIKDSAGNTRKLAVLS